jgi:hypothetical protein
MLRLFRIITVLSVVAITGPVFGQQSLYLSNDTI